MFKFPNANATRAHQKDGSGAERPPGVGGEARAVAKAEAKVAEGRGERSDEEEEEEEGEEEGQEEAEEEAEATSAASFDSSVIFKTERDDCIEQTNNIIDNG
ncbi:Protein of unknown function [Gryllus bimaculatus]|nr:Protein of unknown function [Gryllus bimaculatus]